MSVTEKKTEGDEDEEKQKAQRLKGRAWETRGQLFSHTLISKQTSHRRNTSDNFVVCLTFSQFSHFSEHFFYTPFTGASAASTCPSSCPWGLIPQHQFVLEEDRGLAFIHPSVAPNSNLSDLLSVWHLTPLSLKLIHLHAVHPWTVIHLWGNFCVLPDSLTWSIEQDWESLKTKTILTVM